MNKLYIKEDITYVGTQLSPHWIYRNYNLMGDAIVAFEGRVEVNLPEMVDIEDVINSEPIASDRMLSFIIENFEVSLVEMVVRQRLFISIIKEVLESYGVQGVTRNGDDLFFEGKKLSVSIATKSITSSLIHTALNIVSTGAPIDVCSLNDMGIDNIEVLANDIMGKFADEISSIRLAATKVRGVI